MSTRIHRFLPGGGGSAGYDTSAASAFQMHSMQLNAAQQQRAGGAAAVTNIMLAAEQIRVDCVQLTTNGRYVVTGSIYGPPQVWDLKVLAVRAFLSLAVWRSGSVVCRVNEVIRLWVKCGSAGMRAASVTKSKMC